MEITISAWKAYKKRLAKIDTKALTEMAAYINKIHGWQYHEKEVLNYAFGLATKYGEAAAAAACEFYDAVAQASGKHLPPAEPAETATYSETAKAVYGTVKNRSEEEVPNTVGRLVKQAGADTTLKNAARDGAQFAWVPSGDTCPFCIMLASNGWQYMGKKALRGGHAEHIHANCDCQYAIRFDSSTTVAGYDPDYYRQIYDNADGYNWQQKLRSMEHDHREAHKDEINARRRELYAEKKTLRPDIKDDTVNTRESYSNAAKLSDDFVQPKEVYRDYSDFKPLNDLSNERMEDLRKLNKLAKDTGHEYGISVSDGVRSKFYSNDDHDNVTIYYPTDAKYVELYHSHTDDSVLSSGDFQSVLDPRIAKTTVSSLNGDIWQVDYTTGFRPTEKELNDVIIKLKADVRASVEMDPSFSHWTHEEREYMRGRELMYRVAHYFEWDIKGGYING